MVPAKAADTGSGGFLKSEISKMGDEPQRCFGKVFVKNLLIETMKKRIYDK
jgi:hypothetical protein